MRLLVVWITASLLGFCMVYQPSPHDIAGKPSATETLAVYPMQGRCAYSSVTDSFIARKCNTHVDQSGNISMNGQCVWLGKKGHFDLRLTRTETGEGGRRYDYWLFLPGGAPIQKGIFSVGK